MKLTKNIAKLVCDLEYLVGTRCYKIYNGYTDKEDEPYRYPVMAEINNQEYQKFYNNINDDCPTLKVNDVRTFRYRFGNNELDIGMGIIDILDFLEDRYNLNFTELEKNIKSDS